MITPDLIVCWPRNCDYPLWRSFIRKNRPRFNEVFIVFTETHQGADFREFVKEQMGAGITFIQSREIFSGEDWRNVGVNMALDQSKSEWVWFTEQDFLPKKDLFWGMVDANLSMHVEVIGVLDGSRLHPCCLFMKRSKLDSLDKNFGIIADKLDHFGLIQMQLSKGEETKIGIIPGEFYHHMAGLSHNMRLLESEGKPNHGVEDFNRYVSDCLNLNIPLAPGYREMFEKYLQTLA